MSTSQVYDLGELDLAREQRLAEQQTAQPQPPAARGSTRRDSSAARPSRADAGPASRSGRVGVAAPSLSLLLPGAGHILRGETAAGICLAAWAALSGTLVWALAQSFDRLVVTLGLLGWPPEAAAAGIVVVYGAAVALHVAGVFSAFPAGSTGPGPHPVLAGGASLVLPGWGQILNGDRRRAAFFLTGAWTVATMWILASPRVEEFLGSAGLVLPYAVQQLCSATVRSSVTVALWVLAVYDAAASAAQRR